MEDDVTIIIITYGPKDRTENRPQAAFFASLQAEMFVQYIEAQGWTTQWDEIDYYDTAGEAIKVHENLEWARTRLHELDQELHKDK